MPSSPNLFTRFSKAAARWTGHPSAFLIAAMGVALWACSGPLFHFGDTWQLVINTTTTIITFLMVFLIQNTQNRDTAAIQIKLDELIRVTENAHNSLLDLEELDERQLDEFHRKFENLAAQARRKSATQSGDSSAADPMPGP